MTKVREITLSLLMLIALVGTNSAVAKPGHAQLINASSTGSADLHAAKAKKFKRRASSSLVRYLNPRSLRLRSNAAAVVDTRSGRVLYGRRISKQRSIASVTKLMTAMVILDARLPLHTPIRISRADKDYLKFTRSRRLPVGSVLRRKDMLYLALAVSENRASHALARTYPGGKRAFVRAMNLKARQLGMKNTRFFDSSGLEPGNRSTAFDLVKLVQASYDYPTIRHMTTSGRGFVRELRSGRIIRFMNTNRLVRRSHWDINISKTGYIRESGYCLVMHATIMRRPVVIVLLQSNGRYSKFGDANRIRRWITRAALKKGRSKGRRSRSHDYAFSR